jgi:hypothetical protein
MPERLRGCRAINIDVEYERRGTASCPEFSAAEVDQFFRLAGTMIQNLNIERYGRK